MDGRKIDRSMENHFDRHIISCWTSNILLSVQLDCQEKNSVAQKSDTLSFFCGGMCSNKNYIYKSRYLGSGTFNFIICMFIVNIGFINKIL